MAEFGLSKPLGLSTVAAQIMIATGPARLRDKLEWFASEGDRWASPIGVVFCRGVLPALWDGYPALRRDIQGQRP
jgi:hypothetical protein